MVAVRSLLSPENCLKIFNIHLSAKQVHTTNNATKTEKLDNGIPPANLKDMSLIGNRVRTYMYWPSTSSVNVFELARAGFVFTGIDDVVKCFQCKGTLKMWKPGDNPLDSHREFYPDCPHIMALDVIKKPNNTQTQLDDLLTVCEGVGHRLHQLRSLQRKTSGVEPGRELSAPQVLNLKYLIVSFQNKS